MLTSFSQKHPVLWAYLFFFYFSGVCQVLIYSSGMSGSVGLRDALLMSALWLVPILLWPSKTRIIAGFIGLILWASALVSLGYWLIYGQDFSQSAIFVAFESNFTESGEFISSYFRWWYIPVFTVFSVIPWLLWNKIRPFELKRNYRLSLATVVVLVLSWPLTNYGLIRGYGFDEGAYHLKNRMEPAVPWSLVVGFSKYRAQLSAMQANLALNEQIPPLKNFSTISGDTPKTLVLVIGESTNRQRMSLYGYPRNTTPKLDEIKDALVVFNDVITPRPYTIEALQQVLSFADQQNFSAYTEMPTLLNMMKQAGYDITWITNQQTQTRRNTVLTTLSQLADHQIYLNNNRAQNASQYDGLVLSPFSEALASSATKKLIVVHLLGTHRKYAYRYPPEFEKFRLNTNTPDWINDDILAEYNSYDNAILYNDYVVSELITTLGKNPEQSALVYLSDHGEEVYDYPDSLFCGRNEGKPSPAMYTVPFVLWTSPAYRDANNTTQWKSYENRPYTTADFIYTWADIAGLNFTGMDYSRSLISDKFTEHPRWIGSPEEKKALRKYADVFQKITPSVTVNSPITSSAKPPVLAL